MKPHDTKLVQATFEAFRNSYLFQNIPQNQARMMAEIAVDAFQPFIKASDDIAELSIEADMQAMDTFGYVAKQKEQLRTAYGMFLNGLSYHNSSPDDKADAAYLQKQATYWFLCARYFLPEDTHGQCIALAKAAVSRAQPIVCRTNESAEPTS